jgi:hypothetical protein
MELSSPSVFLLWLLPACVLPVLWVYFRVRDAVARRRYERCLDEQETGNG